MNKKYTSSVNKCTARPRSQRLQTIGGSCVIIKNLGINGEAQATPIDLSMSATSSRAVANKVIKAYADKVAQEAEDAAIRGALEGLSADEIYIKYTDNKMSLLLAQDGGLGTPDGMQGLGIVSIPEGLLSDYAKKEETSKTFATIAALNLVDGRLTAIEDYFSSEEDADTLINKWNEIVAFLNATEGTTLDNILSSKADKSDIPTKVGQLENDKGYITEHQDISGLATKKELGDGLNSKQNVISDLDTIRAGAALGATALQAVPDNYVTEKELTDKGYITSAAIANKVDKEDGKGLSSNDYTDAEKSKLASIADGAEVNVQSDWLELNSNSDAYIKHRTHGIKSTQGPIITIRPDATTEGTILFEVYTDVPFMVNGIPYQTLDMLNKDFLVNGGFGPDVTFRVVEEGGSYFVKHISGIAVVDYEYCNRVGITLLSDIYLPDTIARKSDIENKPSLDDVKEYTKRYISKAVFDPTKTHDYVVGSVDYSEVTDSVGAGGKSLNLGIDLRIKDDIANAAEDDLDNGVFNNGLVTAMGVKQYIDGLNLDQLTYDSVIGALGFTPFDSAAFTKASIKNALGIADWALAASKPSYDFSEITGKPTTLSGYGITDGVKWASSIGSSEVAEIGYGYSENGWKTGGPAISFGTTGYILRLQGQIDDTDNPRIYASFIYGGVAKGWAELLTAEGLAKQYLDTQGLKVGGDFVLHRYGDAETYLNYGAAINDGASLHLYGKEMLFYVSTGEAALYITEDKAAFFTGGIGLNGDVVTSWSDLKSRITYNFSEVGSKPTTLAGYGITDALVLAPASERRATTDNSAFATYAYGDNGWIAYGPALAFPNGNYKGLINIYTGNGENNPPRMWIGGVYEGVQQSWVEVLTDKNQGVMQVRGRLGATDANTLFSAGSYEFWGGAETANSPSGYATLLVSRGGANSLYFTSQLLTDAGGHLFSRMNEGGGTDNWRPWRTILDDANISSYAISRSVADSLYLTLTGGTISGNVFSGAEIYINNDGYVDKFFHSKCAGYEIGFGIGAGNVNRGIFDFTYDQWWIMRDGNMHTNITGTVNVFGLLSSDAGLKIGGQTIAKWADVANYITLPYLEKDTFLMPTNAFDYSSGRLEHSYAANALYAADKRFSVSGSGFSYFDASQLFDGSYESAYCARVETGATATMTISNNGSSIIAGYPYGEIYLSFYNDNVPADVTVEVYCNYASQGIGWKTLTLKGRRGVNNDVWYYNNSYYDVTQLRITITASASIAAALTEIDWHLSRAALSNLPIVTKFGIDQELWGRLICQGGITLGNETITSWDDLKASGDYLPLTGGTISGSLKVNGGFRAESQYGHYINFDGFSLTANAGLKVVSGYSLSLAGESITSWARLKNYLSFAFSEITSKPTTLSGYGITDALPKSGGTLTGSLDIGTNELKSNGNTFLQSYGAVDTYIKATSNIYLEAPYVGFSVPGVGVFGVVHAANYKTELPDIVLQSGGVNITGRDQYKHLGYGYADGGWKTAGPVFSFGIPAFQHYINCEVFSNKVYHCAWNNGTQEEWALLLDDKNIGTTSLPSLNLNGETITSWDDVGATPTKSQTATSGTVSIAPNVLNKWSSALTGTLTITFASGASGVANYYMIEFTTGATVPTIILPIEVKWEGGYNILNNLAANTTYQISVLNNLAVGGAFV